METVIFEKWFSDAVQSLDNKTPELRDLIAIQAMNAIINAQTSTSLNEILNERQSKYFLKAIPEAAYKLADAMLEARKN